MAPCRIASATPHVIGLWTRSGARLVEWDKPTYFVPCDLGVHRFCIGICILNRLLDVTLIEPERVDSFAIFSILVWDFLYLFLFTEGITENGIMMVFFVFLWANEEDGFNQ